MIADEKPAAPPVNLALEKELKELLKQRSRNTEKIGQNILKMITEKPGGLNAKNQAAVFQYLHKTLSFTMTQLEEYVKIGRGLLLVEVCNMPSNPARLASHLGVKDQRILVFNGVDVVVDVNKPPVKKRLHQFSDEEAERVIDKRIGKIRDAALQRKLMQTVPSPTPEDLLVFSRAGENYYVRVRHRAPLADLEFLVKELKRRKVPSISDPRLRLRLEKELEREFPLPQGASLA